MTYSTTKNSILRSAPESGGGMQKDAKMDFDSVKFKKVYRDMKWFVDESE